MNSNDKEFNEELHAEFLKSLHDEKVKTQEERATYTTAKLAFVTGLFGLGSLKVGGMDFHWLLYIVPLVAIGYDLYIRAADSSIKKIGAFLRRHPEARTAKGEQAWEQFSAKYRDALAPLAATLFTLVATIAAAIYIFAHEVNKGVGFWAGFILWLALCLSVIIWLWVRHRDLIRRIDSYTPDEMR